MLLKKLLIENFGIYAGQNEFNLTPHSSRDQTKPVILFGGKNGSGKTTFLEALRLILYGKNSFNFRATQAEYETYLRDRIHSNESNSSSRFAKLKIEFDFVTLGENTSYIIERGWEVKNPESTVKESLKIIINGKQEESVSEEYWQGFIESILPERLARLFFFDGEKIKDIASDEYGDKMLGEAIKSLLGVDLVERLKADLVLYKNKEVKKDSIQKDKNQWSLIEKEIDRLENSIEQYLSEELPSIRSRIDGKAAEIRKCETTLQSEGNVFATKRDVLKQKQADLISKIDNLNNQIRTECESTYPFSLCPRIVNDLKAQLQTEKQLQKHLIIKNELQLLEQEIQTITRNLKDLDNTLELEFNSQLNKLIKRKTETPSQLTDSKIIFQYADNVGSDIIATLNNAQIQSGPAVKVLSKELQNETELLRKITQELEKIPDDEQIKPILAELSLLNQQSGELKQKEKGIIKELNKLKDSLNNKQKELAKLIERQQSISRLDLVDQARKVLDDYRDKLIANKIKQLQLTVADSYNLLSRKGTVFESVNIDPSDFSVTLYDKTGNAFPRKKLSSGEKQLYAIAMLWGLAKTSKRPLPIIIDTPLARLDSDHRINLVKNYFPKASHQVLLLSTDTEIDKDLFLELSPYVSHSYNLTYNKNKQHTEITKQYFWMESECPV